jgi:hypothetical protein
MRPRSGRAVRRRPVRSRSLAKAVASRSRGFARCAAMRTHAALAVVSGSWGSCLDHSFLTPPGVAGRRQRCPAFMPAVLHVTRGCDIRPTRQPLRRSWRSCVPSATDCTADGYAGWSWCCGEPVFASLKPSRCVSPTSTAAAVHCWSVAAREDAAARSGWTAGGGRSLSRGSLPGSRCRSVRCSASSTGARVGARGPPAGATVTTPAPADGRATPTSTHLARHPWPADAGANLTSRGTRKRKRDRAELVGTGCPS